jgi:hypothetical protein
MSEIDGSNAGPPKRICNRSRPGPKCLTCRAAPSHYSVQEPGRGRPASRVHAQRKPTHVSSTAGTHPTTNGFASVSRQHSEDGTRCVVCGNPDIQARGEARQRPLAWHGIITLPPGRGASAAARTRPGTAVGVAPANHACRPPLSTTPVPRVPGRTAHRPTPTTPATPTSTPKPSSR